MREPLRAILLEQKQQFEKALRFHKELEQAVPAEERWKLEKESPLHDDLAGTVPVDIISPMQVLEIVIQTMDEYIVAIDSFTDEQFSAFLLGLGLNWLPLRYWGIHEMQNYYAKIQKARIYYEELETNIREDEHWKVEKRDPFSVLDELVPPRVLRPTEVLGKARELVAGMLSVLEERSF